MEITLNLICQSNATPTVSSYAHLSRPFNYNKMPLAPMGCNAQIHKKTDNRGTWAYHSVSRWYINTSPEHYQTHVYHIKATRNKRLSYTVDFKDKCITNPTITHADKIMSAIQEVIQTKKGLGGVQQSQEAQELQQLVDSTLNILLNTPPAPRVIPTSKGNPACNIEPTPTHTQPPPRVEYNHNNPPGTSNTTNQANRMRSQTIPTEKIIHMLPPAMCTQSKARESPAATGSMKEHRHQRQMI
jgi:hypothetical protein